MFKINVADFQKQGLKRQIDVRGLFCSEKRGRIDIGKNFLKVQNVRQHGHVRQNEIALPGFRGDIGMMYIRCNEQNIVWLKDVFLIINEGSVCIVDGHQDLHRSVPVCRKIPGLVIQMHSDVRVLRKFYIFMQAYKVICVHNNTS